jgi:serine/threonine protein kinase
VALARAAAEGLAALHSAELLHRDIKTENLLLDDQHNVKIADFDALVAAYLASLPGSGTQNYLKMIPYTVIEYYGPLTNFDGTGAGISALGYDKIYLCNGSNGTPDKRGRVGVGAIDGVPGGPLDAEVNPSYAGNPNYASTDIGGTNSVILNTSQLPAHTHVATATTSSSVSDPGHRHYCGNVPNGWGGSGTVGMVSNGVQNVPTTSVTTGISVNTQVYITNAPTGDGAAHSNIQPVLACYYIMYIP